MHLPSTTKLLLLCLACLLGQAGGAFAQTAPRTTYYKDSDGDGFGDLTKPKISKSPVRGFVLNALDCNDRDPAVKPGATEVKDGKDNDCDGMTDEVPFYQDNDGDEFGSAVAREAVSRPAGYAATPGDCDDAYDQTYPGAPETCDGRDNDCDAAVDEGVKTTFYADADKDGFGDPDASVQACSVPDGYVTNQTDADDADNTVYPGATEICDDKDNNQDGRTDEGVKTVFYADADQDGFGDPNATTEACSVPAGYVTNNTDADDADNTIYPGAPETCDGKDNDQDGQTDEGVKTVFYADADGDGFGNPNATAEACSVPAGYAANNADANDADGTTYPGATELCDNKDNDQDGQVDEGLVLNTYYRDADGDYRGNPDVTVLACSRPAGYSTEAGDCNDTDASIYRGAFERCGDGKDNDCNGTVDDTRTYYRDSDGDGYGSSSGSILACSQPTGFVWRGGDCNDRDPGINPNARERCDGKDNDCNGLVDDNVNIGIWIRDADRDGWGAGSGVYACTQPSGYVYYTQSGDCNDSDRTTYPGATEICDGRDNDCDGRTDEDVLSRWYRDADGDGYGNTAFNRLACSQPTGFIAQPDDCNDNDASIYLGAPELCDGKDNNCSGTIDEACTPAAARMAAPGATERTLRPASSLYPNPATRELTIDLSRPAADLKSIAFATVVDQPVATHPHAVVGESRIRIRVSEFKPGIYVIRLDFGDGYEVLKFLKQ